MRAMKEVESGRPYLVAAERSESPRVPPHDAELKE